jgi:colanic acid/amylovoran biosynthesis glycosyltransferase
VDVASIRYDFEDRPKQTDVIQILTIARLHYIKGIDLLIEAAALLKKREIRFCWKVIGSGTKNYQERYQYHIFERGLENEVQLTGKLSHNETIALLKDADLYIQPSLNEGFCNAVLEAQASGKLTIASKVGGLPENIVDGETGWLFESYSAEALVEKIAWAIALSEEEKSAMAQKAQQRVEKEFNIEKQQQEFVGFYTTRL